MYSCIVMQHLCIFMMYFSIIFSPCVLHMRYFGSMWGINGKYRAASNITVQCLLQFDFWPSSKTTVQRVVRTVKCELEDPGSVLSTLALSTSWKGQIECWRTLFDTISIRNAESTLRWIWLYVWTGNSLAMFQPWPDIVSPTSFSRRAWMYTVKWILGWLAKLSLVRVSSLSTSITR